MKHIHFLHKFEMGDVVTIVKSFVHAYYSKNEDAAFNIQDEQANQLAMMHRMSVADVKNQLTAKRDAARNELYSLYVSIMKRINFLFIDHISLCSSSMEIFF